MLTPSILYESRASETAIVPKVVTAKDHKNKPFKLNEKQKEALQLIKDNQQAMDFLFVGGSRSGKTFFTVHLIFIRGLKYPNSRHIICRLRMSHAITSLWMDTIPKVLRVMGLVSGYHYKLDKTNHCITLYNGSEIWLDGLDNAERVERMLGREYNTIYYNEISQIPYDTVTTVMSRLSMVAYDDEGNVCRNYSIYDCNPPSKRHWSYKLWYQGKDPIKDALISDERRANYRHLKMNPTDNVENLSPTYIALLESMPPAKRKRFLDGEYGDVEGQIFDNWKVVSYVPDEIKDIASRTIGIDFGFTVDPAAAVQCWFVKKRQGKSQLWIEELCYSTGLTNNKLGAAILDGLRGLEAQKRVAEYRDSGMAIAYESFISPNDVKRNNYLAGKIFAFADCAEPKSIVELNEYFNNKIPSIQVLPGLKGRDSIMAGIDWLLELDIFVTSWSANVIMELESYEWKKDAEGKTVPEPIDEYNHSIDSTRYANSNNIGRNIAQIISVGA